MAEVITLQKTVNLLRGYVRILAECPFPERFLNLCAHNSVAFWGIERIDGVAMEVTIPAKDAARAEEFAVRLGGSLKVIRQSGAVFFLARFKKRYALLAGMVICLAALLISGRYIWDFSVEGNFVLADEEILQALRETGITIGTPVSSVDIEAIRNHMLLKMDGLIWVSVNVTGSHATVVVRERAEKPDIFCRSTPVNIVAEKAGLITRIDTLSGSAKVFTGDTVEQGQLLVSGLVDSGRLGVRLMNARAEVTARTWTELKAVTPTGAVGKNYTGRSKTRTALVFVGRRINLSFRSSQPYAMCDKISKTSVLRLPQNVVFPIALVRETYVEYEPVSYRMAEDVAEDFLRIALEEELNKGIVRGEILSGQFTFRPSPGLATAVLTAEAIERIDLSRRIELSEALGPG
jgi:similar to stage IV sporulation protein